MNTQLLVHIETEATHIELEWRRSGFSWSAIGEIRRDPASNQAFEQLVERVRQLWHISPEWLTLLELGKRYIWGKLPACAAYPMPVEPETDLIKNSLCRLHDHGLITLESCPPSWDDTMFDDDTGKPKLVRQRAWIQFLLPTGLDWIRAVHISGFINLLQRHPGLDLSIEYYYPAGNFRNREELSHYTDIPSRNPPETFHEEEGSYCHEQDMDKPRKSRPVNLAKFEDAGWSGRTGIEDFEQQRPIPATYDQDPLHFTVVSRYWPEGPERLGNDLQDIIIDQLHRAEINPISYLLHPGVVYPPYGHMPPWRT